MPKQKLHNITINGDIFRYKFAIAKDYIEDEEDGDLTKLKVILKKADGSNVPIDSWIQYDSNTLHFEFYTSRALLDTVYQKSLSYQLEATDKDGNTGAVLYNFYFATRRSLPIYVVKLTLTSSLSAVYSSNDVKVLFFIQQNKLFPYATANSQPVNKASDLITEVLDINRNSNGQSTIKLWYSTKIFLTTNCNVQNIIKMRSKMIGTNKAKYENIFKNEFQIVKYEEQFNGACQYLSTDPPQPSIGILNSISISFGVYFTQIVPSDMFKAPATGQSMEISIELRSENGGNLEATSWIQLSGSSLTAGVQISAYPPYNVVANRKNFVYFLVGKTPLLEETSKVMTVFITNFQPITESYIVSFISTGQQLQYTVFIKSFITSMAMYLGVKETNILVYSYDNNVNGKTTLKWTLNEFTKQNIDASQVSTISSKLYESKGLPNKSLVQVLLAIGFQLSFIKVTVAGNLVKPQISKPIASFITWKTFFFYEIPKDAFIDATDGYHLKFELIPDGSPFSPTNWLTVNSTSRVIQGVPIAAAIEKDVIYSFKLRVTNSLGNSIDTSFSTKSKDEVPSFNYKYTFTLTYNQNAESVANILLLFMKNLIAYLNEGGDNLIVTNTVTIPLSRSIRIFFFNSSFRLTPCDTNAINRANSNIFYGRDPNPNLVEAIKSNFIINEIITTNFGSCLINLPPYIDPNYLSSVGPHNIRWGETFYKRIDARLFNDEEDGSSREMKIHFKPIGSNIEISKESWIYYNKNTMTVYAVPMQKSFTETNSRGEIKYVMRATDSGGKSVATEYIVVLSGEITTLYNVTMSINLFGIGKQSYAEQLITIIHHLEIWFGESFKNKICVQNYQIGSHNGNDASAIFIWTHCDIPLKTCDFALVNNIRNVIYNPGTSQINTKLNSKHETFQVIGVVDIGLGACGLNAPEITYQISVQLITFCGLYSYQIPNNAFTDKEDGSTRNLQLSMSKTDGSPLDEWMEFDRDKQILSMLLSRNMNSILLQREQKFILTATDSSKLTRSQFISVKIGGNPDTVDYKKIVQFTKSSEFIISKKNTFIEIARKVGTYLNDNARSFEAIQSSKTSNGDFVYEFGNCLIKSNPCDAVAMQNYRNRLSQSSFLNIFQPEFLLKSSSDSFAGPCASDGPPKLINQWSTLQVDISKTYTFTVPSNTFEDKEQGFTKTLDLELRDFTGNILKTNYWVEFDSSTQTLTVIATKEIALTLQPSSTVTLKLYAYDIKKQYAVMSLVIHVNYPKTQFSHYITMQLTVSSKRSTYTTIYNTLRRQIITYFHGDVSAGLVAYTTATNIFTTTMEVRWSNTTISSIKCENEKLQYMLGQIYSSGVQIHPQFVKALSNFNVINVYFSYDGICADERTPPVVKKPIPSLQTTYCGSISYRIPEETFNDRIDGHTRNMKLSMTFTNGSVVSKNTFIAFDDVKQHLYVTPISLYFKSIENPIILLLKATTNRGLFVSTNIEVYIQNPPPSYNFYVNINGEWDSSLLFTQALQKLQSITSSYLGYSSSQVHLVNVIKQPSNLFTSTLAFCSLKYDPCDKIAIGVIINKIKNNQNYVKALKPNIQLLSLTTTAIGACADGDQPPSVIKEIPDVTLEVCSTFKYTMDPNIFSDIEDGNNLSFLLTSLNNSPIEEKDTWIYSTSSKEILATINSDVIKTSSTFEVNIRAYDKKQQFVDTQWNIYIMGTSRLSFYSYKLTLNPKEQVNQAFVDKYRIASSINAFFGGNITNVISLEYKNSGAVVLFTFSSCVLPQYCDSNGARDLLSRLQTQQFKDALSPYYILSRVEMTSNSNCNKPLNPPTASRLSWDLNVDVCGGLSVRVPQNMFIDSEDGDTRNLVLTFSDLQNSNVLADWMRFDGVTQTLSLYPTYQEASEFKSGNILTYILKATDKSGLSATITIKFTMKLPQEAKYKFKFQYRNTGQELDTVQNRRLFVNGLASYLSSSINTIALYSYTKQKTPNSNTEVTFANCSIAYSPSCDLASLKNLKNLLMDENNFPRSSFQLAMNEMSIILLFGSILITAPCKDTYNPPRVEKTLPKISISVCGGYQKYIIPKNTFYDPQDGTDLQYSMTTVQGNTFTTQSWIQFDSLTKTILLMPLVIINTIEKNNYLFSVTATDSTKLSASTVANIEVTGPMDILRECQIEIRFRTTLNSQSNLIQRLTYIHTQLKTFFQLKTNEGLALVEYTNTDRLRFTLSFGYCSPLYSSNTIQVDYHNFVNTILMKLFQTDRTSLSQTFFSIFGGRYIVENVQPKFTGRCSNIPPIVPDNTPPITFSINSCGYTQTSIRENQFYDFEDGTTSNLKLELYSTTGEIVPIDNWVNVDSQSRSIIAVCNDIVRNVITTIFNFILRVTDSKGLTKDVAVIIKKSPITLQQIAPFDITFEMQYNGEKSRPMVYQLMYLIQRIRLYYDLTQTPGVYIKGYRDTSGFPNYKQLTWTSCTGSQCNINGIFDKTKKLYNTHRDLDNQFLNNFSPQFTIKRVYYISTKCSPQSDPPYIQKKIPPLISSYCSIFTYKIPDDMFYDNLNGGTKHLKLSLTDGNGVAITTSSIMQFNQATLQLLAVNVESQQPRMMTYQLSATNSVGLTSTNSFQMQYDSKPYISNCPVSMEFKYKYLTSTTTDVDVLIQMTNKITQYFKDQRIMIKIIDFKRLGNNLFQMKWTNCTFQFVSLQQASNGLTESQRSQLTSIFSKVINVFTNVVNPTFQEAISLSFILNFISVSYTCIEVGPKPNNDQVQREYATPCQLFKSILSNNLFTDERDVDIRGMTLMLTYMDGTPVSNDEWLQIDIQDKNNQFLYGTVTSSVQLNAVDRKYFYQIKCTDSSGRSSFKKISISIISNNQTLFTNTITLGFTSSYSQQIPTAFVLSKLTKKLANFLDPTDESVRIHVSEFNRISMIRYSYCEMQCSLTNINLLYKKFQIEKYRSQPSLSLRDALKKKFDTSYVFIDTSKCLPTTSISIVVKQCPAISINMCGQFTRQIPRECFIDITGSDTRSFLLNLKTEEGKTLSKSSWIQFDVPKQIVYGSVVVDRASANQVYKLQATHPSSGKTATNNLQITLNGFNDLSDIENEVCKITLQFADKTIYSNQDVTVLQNLISTINGYINSPVDSLVVMKFTRQSELITLSYANCTWIQNLRQGVQTSTYLKSVEEVLEKYFRITQMTVVGIMSSFQEHLTKNNYKFLNVFTSIGCTQPPNPPPVRIRELVIDLTVNCGIFTYQVPEDTFIDRKYGNTRQLTLSLLSEDGQSNVLWITINTNQQIYGMIDKIVSEYKPTNGYRFILKATNPVGQSSTTSIAVNIPKKNWSFEFMELSMRTTPSISEDIFLPYKYALINKIQQFQGFKGFSGAFYVKHMSTIPSMFNMVTIGYCEQCSGTNYLIANGLKRSDKQRQLIDFLSPSFSVQSGLIVDLPSVELLRKECQGIPDALDASYIKEMGFCTRNVWKLADTFTEMIESFTVSLVNVDNSELVSSSWTNLLSNPYRIISFPTETQWKTQPEDGYQYKILLMDKKNQVLGVPLIFSFKIIGTPKSDGLSFTISLTSSSVEQGKPDIYYINNIWSKLDNYLGVINDFQHITFTKSKLSQMSLTWFDCSLPSDCNGVKVNNVRSKLFNGESANSALSKSFLPDYKIIGLTEKCSDNPPIVQTEYKITVPQCGYYVTKLPDNFAFDEKDGSRLTIELLAEDGVSKLPRSSWIIYKTSTKTIEALADDFIINTYDKTEGFIYTFKVYDTKGKFSLSKLIVHLQLESSTNYLTYTSSFQSFYPLTTSYVEIKKKFLEYFIGQANGGDTINNIQVGSLSLIDERSQKFVIRLKNCSVSQYTCPVSFKKLKEISDDLVGNGKSRLIQQIAFVSGNQIVISDISRKFDTIRDETPIFANSIKRIELTYCDNGMYIIPTNTFIDREQNILKYKLYTNNGEVVSNTHWVNLIDNKLYISPLISIAPGKYTYKLEASDVCDMKATTNLVIKLSGEPIKSPYSLVMQFQFKSHSINYAHTIWNLRKRIQICVGKLNEITSNKVGIVNGIRSEEFVSTNTGYIKYQWSDCTLKTNPCLQNAMDKMSARIFASPNMMSESFKECFQPDCELQQVSEIRIKECAPTSPPPLVQQTPKLNTTFCKKFTFVVPQDTFIDSIGQNARTMNLELLTENFELLPKNEWVQFDSLRQEIYGYPRSGDNNSKYVYKLRATQPMTGASSSTEIEIKLIGRPSINYLMQVKGMKAINNQPNINEEIKLLNILQQVTNAEDLDDISFERNKNQIDFKWSFCHKEQVCDCHQLQKFQNRKQEIKQALTSIMTVTSLIGQKYGQCNEGPVELNPIPKNEKIPVGQCYSLQLPENMYYDRQDRANLNMFVRSEDVSEFPPDHWLQLDQSNSRICGILPYQTFLLLERNLEGRTYKYQIGADDLCGNRIVNNTRSIINEKTYLFIDYILVGIIEESKENFMGNCSRIDLFIIKVANYSGVNKTDVFVKEINAYNETTRNITQITWGYRVVNCSNETISTFKSLYFDQQAELGRPNPAFEKHMKPEFHITRLRNDSGGDCAIAPVVAARTDPEGNFPWWVFWLILCLALLVLLCWLLWLCCPRACPGLCDKTSCWICCGGLCGKCCTKPGIYSSFKEQEQFAKPDDIEGGKRFIQKISTNNNPY